MYNEMYNAELIYLTEFTPFGLQCFDTVGWVAGRASSL